MSLVEINVHQKERVAEIWLTNEEKKNEKLMQSLKPLFQEYKSQKFTVAVFCSGEGDLMENTTRLLRQNKMI